MDNAAPIPDAIDAAIAAADQPAPITMNVMQGAFGDSGRPFEIAVPSDLSEGEAYALIELITNVRQRVFVNEAKQSSLVDLTGRRLPMSPNGG